MADKPINPNNSAQQLLAKLRSVSSEFADAALYIANESRGRVHAAMTAMHDGDVASASAIFDEMKNSSVVQRFSTALVSIKDKVGDIKETVLGACGSPLLKLVGGLTLVTGAALAMAQLGALLATLLIIAGIILALSGIYSLIKDQTIPALQAE